MIQFTDDELHEIQNALYVCDTENLMNLKKEEISHKIESYFINKTVSSDNQKYYSVRKIQELSLSYFGDQIDELPKLIKPSNLFYDYNPHDSSLWQGLGKSDQGFIVQQDYIEQLRNDSRLLYFAYKVEQTCEVEKKHLH